MAEILTVTVLGPASVPVVGAVVYAKAAAGGALLASGTTNGSGVVLLAPGPGAMNLVVTASGLTFPVTAKTVVLNVDTTSTITGVADGSYPVTQAISDLTKLSTVKAELGIAVSDTHVDAVLMRLIAAASSAAATFVGRELHYAVVTDERVRGYSTSRLRLARTPIVGTVTSIGIDGSTVDSTDYHIANAKAGIVYRASGFSSTAPYRGGLAAPDLAAGEEEDAFLVTYAGGWVTPIQDGTGTPALVRSLPAEIEEAVILAVVQAYRRRGKHQGLATESEDKTEVQWGGLFLPGPSKALLRQYKRIG